MIPILYDKSETKFESNGIGRLVDAISCICTEERNGAYTVTMEYPVQGAISGELVPERIISVIAHDGDEKTQPFRINAISVKDKKKTVTCQHISYQTNAVYAEPYNDGRYSDNPLVWMQWITEHITDAMPFKLSSDIGQISTTKKMPQWTIPKTVKSLLMGEEGSLLDLYGGEYLYDRYDIKLLKNRGRDNGVRIVYGKNLVSADQSIDLTDTWTSVIAYWEKEEEKKKTCIMSARMDRAGASYAYHRTKVIDVTSDFEEQPTKEQLNDKARSYLNGNYGEPKFSVKAQFIPLYKSLEYKDLAGIEHVNLCDTVTVTYPMLGINQKTKVVKTAYNVLMDRYDSVEIGEIRQSIADTMLKMVKDGLEGRR